MAPGREWILLLSVVGVCSSRLAGPAEISAMAGVAQCRPSKGDVERSVVEGLGVPAPSCLHVKIAVLIRGPTLGRVVNVEGKPGGGGLRW